MMGIKKHIKNLNEKEISSLILFNLYKLNEIPEYSTLSELPYILDMPNFLKLIEYYGGMTITLPTLDEYEDVLNTLLLYQYLNVDNIPENKARKLICERTSKPSKVFSLYDKLNNVLQNYDFKRK